MGPCASDGEAESGMAMLIVFLLGAAGLFAGALAKLGGCVALP